jgi:hypothetical protein
MHNPRYTHEKLDAEIATLQAQDPVFKVDVDEVKRPLSVVYGNERDVLMSLWIAEYRDGTDDEAQSALYHDLPFELRHLYGKKYQKLIADTPEGKMRAAIVEMAERMRPRFDAVQELIARQQKGRKPSAPKKVIDTRTQLRAVCPCCFRQHAVRGPSGVLVNHGYTLGYGFQNGNCTGAGAPHFGSEAGRDWTANYARRLREMAEAARTHATKIEAGEAPVTNHRGRRIEEPDEHQRRSAARRAREEGTQMDNVAAQREELVKNWKAAEPVEVEVEITE